MEVEEFLKSVGQRIAKVREFRGLTRRELGLAIGMKEASANAGIYAVETAGHGTQIDTIFRIANALAVSPGFLLDGGELTISTTTSV